MNLQPRQSVRQFMLGHGLCATTDKADPFIGRRGSNAAILLRLPKFEGGGVLDVLAVGCDCSDPLLGNPNEQQNPKLLHAL